MNTDSTTRTLYARQTIVDRCLAIVGFELLFRADNGRNAVPARFDGDRATSRVLINAFVESDIDTTCDHKPVFVNFTANTLFADLPFSPKKLVVEVLESVTPTPAVIAAVRRLRHQGYRIALDDYIRDDASHPLIPHVDIVKLEYPRYAPAALRRTVAALRRANPDITVLAEKIETQRDLECCRKAGCDLFQGYFLSRPERVRGTVGRIHGRRTRRLVAALDPADAALDRVLPLIAASPAQQRRILRLARDCGARPDTLSEAVHALGRGRLRALAILLALCKPRSKAYALRHLRLDVSVRCHHRFTATSGAQGEARSGHCPVTDKPLWAQAASVARAAPCEGGADPDAASPTAHQASSDAAPLERRQTA